MDEKSDPNILNRMSKQPPFVDDKGNVSETEEKQEELVQEVEEKNEVAEQPEVETQNTRTSEQFDKLKGNNAELKGKNDALELENARLRDEARKFTQQGAVGYMTQPATSQYPMPPGMVDVTNVIPQATQFPGMSQQQVNDVFANLTDDQGYVNVDLLRQELSKAHKQTQSALEEAKRAREEAKRASQNFDNFQRSEIAKRVHEKYPELNPDTDNYNTEFFDAVKNEMYTQLVSNGKEDFMAAADKWAKTFVNKKEKKEVKEAMAQINATGTKPSGSRLSYQDHETLVQATRQGKKGALGERLKQAGY